MKRKLTKRQIMGRVKRLRGLALPSNLTQFLLSDGKNAYDVRYPLSDEGLYNLVYQSQFNELKHTIERHLETSVSFDMLLRQFKPKTL